MQRIFTWLNKYSISQQFLAEGFLLKYSKPKLILEQKVYLHKLSWGLGGTIESSMHTTHGNWIGRAWDAWSLFPYVLVSLVWEGTPKATRRKCGPQSSYNTSNYNLLPARHAGSIVAQYLWEWPNKI